VIFISDDCSDQSCETPVNTEKGITMARKKSRSSKRPIENYEHKDKERLNNPPVGLVTPETDQDTEKKSYSYDPHLDPQLVWAGKAEHTSFEVPTVSLHVHERVDPRTIIETVRKKNGDLKQASLFEMPEENPPLRHAIEFYKHSHNWSNRFIAGDSLLVMNSLLEKEGMAGKVQMVYIDPPYGIKYGSNFQPFTNKKNVKDGKDEHLTQEPEMIKAFRDTWELGLHSYLTYLRDRLLLARELLANSGSVFVQISEENVHHSRELMDEVFGPENFISGIVFRKKTMPLGSSTLERMHDFILWYGRSRTLLKVHHLFQPLKTQGDSHWSWLELPDGTRRKLSSSERSGSKPVPEGAKRFQLISLYPPSYSAASVYPVDVDGKRYEPRLGACWITNPTGMQRLITAGRVMPEGKVLRYVLYEDDFPWTRLTSLWPDTIGVQGKGYVVETNRNVIQRCLLLATDPGDLVIDPTCGGGTTAYVAEQWGRRWITCDTSRVAVTVAKQRLMTAAFPYYELAHPDEGVGSGFVHKTAPRIKSKAIANNPDLKEGMTRGQIDAAIAKHAPQETLYDQPIVDKSKARITGPFSVEAVPAPVVRSLDEIQKGETPSSDESVARGGETLRQAEWRDELFRTGVRGKTGQRIEFSRIEPLPGCKWLQADGETKDDSPHRVVVSFGSAYAPLEQRQVDLALEEAQHLVPKPKIVIFAAFQFDPEAAKDIDEAKWPGVSLLKAQMNADLLTEDLKKKRASNESFWLIGQPDITLTKMAKGDSKGKWQVEVQGFDYYNTRSGKVESGGTEKLAMWMLDTDYDGRSLFPSQVFFPMADDKGGWTSLAKNLKAEIDEGLIKQYRGTVSLPFEPGDHKRVAVKMIDDRGIESLKILGIDQ
jgi:adenine-specific DNA-methyltransferase